MNQVTKRNTRTNPMRRLAAAGSAAGLTGVALLMVLAATSAGAVGPGVVITKPYKAVIGAGNSYYHNGCGTAAVLKAANFAKLTGVAGFSLRSTAPRCSFNQGNGGSAYADLYVYIPISMSGGNHNVTFNWTVAVMGSVNYTLGKCTQTGAASYFSCYQDMEIDWGMSTYVLDTNGTSYYPMVSPPNAYFFNYSYNDTYCYSGTCHYYAYNYGATFGTAAGFSVPATNMVWTVPMMKVPAGHHFWAVVDIYGAVSSTGQVYNGVMTGEYGSASLNFATLGNGGTLNSITIV